MTYFQLEGRYEKIRGDHGMHGFEVPAHSPALLSASLPSPLRRPMAALPGDPEEGRKLRRAAYEGAAFQLDDSRSHTGAELETLGEMRQKDLELTGGC